MNSVRLSCAAAFLLMLLASCATAPDVLRPEAQLQCRVTRDSDTTVAMLDRGMGGTGIDRGMGGTGIRKKLGLIGTVTGFGSICVNGVHVAYDAATPITVNGATGTIDMLERGATVAVTASADPALAASTIEIVHALVGPVTAAADASGALSVMGVKVETAFATGDAASLAIGDMATVDGLQRADGVIDATRVTRAPAGARASLRGAVALTPNSVRIAAVPVTLLGDKVALPPTLNGRWVLAQGTWSGGALIVENVVPGIPLETTPVERMSVEGYVVQQGRGYSVRGVPLREDPSRRLDRSSLQSLSAGQRVQVIGPKDSDGAMRIEVIVVPDYRNPLSDATSATQTRAQLQQQRGTYSTTVTRPAADDTAVRSGTVPTRPLQDRPAIPRPPAPPPRRGG